MGIVNMDKIKKVSFHMVRAFNILLIAIPLILLLQWLFISIKTTELSPFINFFGLFEKEVSTPEGLVNLSNVVWTLPLKTLGFFAELIGLMPFLISLFILKSIFNDYQQGTIFSVANAQKYKNLGWISFIDALIIKSCSNSLLVLAVTLTNPPGHRYLTLAFGIPNLKALFLGALLIIISWVMLEASKIYDEQKFTI